MDADIRGCSIVQKIVIKIFIEIGRRVSTVQKIMIENEYSLVTTMCCVLDNDVKLTSQIECFA